MNNSAVSFSFSYLPDQDRIRLEFNGTGQGDGPKAIWLTRRLVKLLGGYLRQHIEQQAEFPSSASQEDRREILAFMHRAEMENNQPRWGKKNETDGTQGGGCAPELITRVDVQATEKNMVLKCFYGDHFRLAVTLGRRKVHSFLFSLAEMSKKADWALDGVFAYIGSPPPEPRKILN